MKLFLAGIVELLAKLFSGKKVQPRQETSEIEHHHVLASSFADPADVRAFRLCKSQQGGTDEQCLQVGDNGIGCWGDDTTGQIPMCALPPEDMIERWGAIDAARRKKVFVSANARDVECLVTDRMKHRANIKNGAGIDLNFAAVSALGLKPPVMVRAIWSWVV